MMDQSKTHVVVLWENGEDGTWEDIRLLRNNKGALPTIRNLILNDFRADIMTINKEFEDDSEAWCHEVETCESIEDIISMYQNFKYHYEIQSGYHFQWVNES